MQISKHWNQRAASAPEEQKNAFVDKEIARVCAVEELDTALIHIDA